MTDNLPLASKRSLRGYSAIALVSFNSFLLFLGLNLGASVMLRVLPGKEGQGAMVYGMDALQRVYPGRAPAEIENLLRETWSRTYVYEPYTQFKEGLFEGDYVRVSAAGFRETGRQQPWPPDPTRVNVLVFGGSTTFGYGVADDETIPSALQELLERRCGDSVSVYNVARSNYFSSQERILFQRLLIEGVRPALAVFVDGLNEFGYAEDAPKFSLRLDGLMRETTVGAAKRVAGKLPLARLIKRVLDRENVSQTPAPDREAAEAIVARWLANRDQIRAVAAAAGVDTLFVWQPIPMYGYDLSHHLFAGSLSSELAASTAGYESMAEIAARTDGPLAEGFLWLADLQRSRKEPLYVDKVHYTAAFSAEIAETIASTVAPGLCSTVGRSAASVPAD